MTLLILHQAFTIFYVTVLYGIFVVSNKSILFFYRHINSNPSDKNIISTCYSEGNYFILFHLI